MDVVLFHVRLVLFLPPCSDIIDLPADHCNPSGGSGRSSDVVCNLLARPGNIRDDLLPCSTVPRLEFFRLDDSRIKFHVCRFGQSVQEMASLRQRFLCQSLELFDVVLASRADTSLGSECCRSAYKALAKFT